MAILHPQELFLQERYLSLEYITSLRDAWKGMIEHLEKCLDDFARNPPAYLNDRPLSERPDLVWGGRVLPNFNRTLEDLNETVLVVKKGGKTPEVYNTLDGMGGGIRSDMRGVMDYGDDWLGTENKAEHRKLLVLASNMAKNIERTANGTWTEGDLTYCYRADYNGPLNLPSQIPLYELDESVTLTGEEEQTIIGFYLPDIPQATPALLYEYVYRPYKPYHTLQANTLIALSDAPPYNFFWKKRECVPCTFTLIRKVEGKFIDVPPEGFFPKQLPEELANWAKETEQEKVTLVQANEKCPKAGYWHALAPDTTRHFEQGEVMPELKLTGFAVTFWYFECTLESKQERAALAEEDSDQ